MLILSILFTYNDGIRLFKGNKNGVLCLQFQSNTEKSLLFLIFFKNMYLCLANIH